jgi:hypothetical protein
MLRELICIAQARVIGGRVKSPHVCSVVFDNERETLLRTCLPMKRRDEMPVRRWTVFTAELERDYSDPRAESYIPVEGSIKETGVLNEAGKAFMHAGLVGMATPEDELVSAKASLGVKLVVPESLRFHVNTPDPHHLHIAEALGKLGIYYPSKSFKISGVDQITGKRFNRMLLDWQIAERLRQNGENYSEIKEVLSRYKHPYFIIGTTPKHQTSFMAISMLSSPEPTAK